MKLAPIVLFVYNRPWHTQQTLNALSMNNLSKFSDLFIFCDGPKLESTKDDLKNIELTREIVKNEKRFQNVKVIKSTFNKGLAESIIQGVTEIVNIYGNIIVLEDDILTSPGFLKYMNDSLELYKHEEKVMHISGYMYPINSKIPETFFIKPTSCWGWATWKRSWIYFEKDVEKQIKMLESRNAWSDFTLNFGFNSYKNQLFLNKENKINTWAIFWYASVYLKEGLSLHPYPSLVQNIGFDGTGINCDNDLKSPYYWPSLAQKIKLRKIKVKINQGVSDKLGLYFLNNYNIKSIPEKMTLRDLFYIKRQKIKKYIKSIYNVLINYKNVEILEKKSTPIFEEVKRYTAGNINFKGYDIKYIDYPSYESTLNELFVQKIYSFNNMNEAPVIIDCGANIGLSILFFKMNYPLSYITAFEADPEVFNCLKENVDSFNFSNIELINKALWDSETQLEFYSEGADGGRLDTETYGNGKIIKVDTICLSDFLHKKIDLLKIDIEGAEFRVLNECKSLLKNVENIFIEYHSFENKPQVLNEILTILKDNGFRFHISSIGVKSFQPFEKINTSLGMDNQLNIFGYRKTNEKVN